MNHEQISAFEGWLKDKQEEHEKLAKAGTEAYKLNHGSRALAFLEARSELRNRINREGSCAVGPSAMLPCDVPDCGSPASFIVNRRALCSQHRGN